MPSKKQTNNTPEQELVKRIMARDEEAYLSFVKTHEQPLFQYVSRQISDTHQAEEIVQDVFVDFLDALRNFQFQSSLKTYLYSIAKYKVIDYIRKKKVKKVIFSAMPAHVVEGLSPVWIESEIEQKELAGKIQTVFQQLPHDYQTILRLKYLDGFRVKEIATRLSLPFKATESLLFRARKAFTQVFSQT